MDVSWKSHVSLHFRKEKTLLSNTVYFCNLLFTCSLLTFMLILIIKDLCVIGVLINVSILEYSLCYVNYVLCS